ncbi:unnamed protein product [Cyclocybe aegerita]|uniref:Uncharacterized protein n=1 Tax=Cyclocybe aegerita TaxID=1973307 RepID=A0A8S0X2N0_CYCAE|nr:unnamed protein product [Cyclocybe aegerita]
MSPTRTQGRLSVQFSVSFDPAAPMYTNTHTKHKGGPPDQRKQKAKDDNGLSPKKKNSSSSAPPGPSAKQTTSTTKRSVSAKKATKQSAPKTPKLKDETFTIILLSVNNLDNNGFLFTPNQNELTALLDMELIKKLTLSPSARPHEVDAAIRGLFPLHPFVLAEDLWGWCLLQVEAHKGQSPRLIPSILRSGENIYADTFNWASTLKHPQQPTLKKVVYITLCRGAARFPLSTDEVNSGREMDSESENGNEAVSNVMNDAPEPKFTAEMNMTDSGACQQDDNLFVYNYGSQSPDQKEGPSLYHEDKYQHLKATVDDKYFDVEKDICDMRIAVVACLLCNIAEPYPPPSCGGRRAIVSCDPNNMAVLHGELNDSLPLLDFLKDTQQIHHGPYGIRPVVIFLALKYAAAVDSVINNIDRLVCAFCYTIPCSLWDPANFQLFCLIYNKKKQTFGEALSEDRFHILKLPDLDQCQSNELTNILAEDFGAWKLSGIPPSKLLSGPDSLNGLLEDVVEPFLDSCPTFSPDYSLKFLIFLDFFHALTATVEPPVSARKI